MCPALLLLARRHHCPAPPQYASRAVGQTLRLDLPQCQSTVVRSADTSPLRACSRCFRVTRRRGIIRQPNSARHWEAAIPPVARRLARAPPPVAVPLREAAAHAAPPATALLPALQRAAAGRGRLMPMLGPERGLALARSEVPSSTLSIINHSCFCDVGSRLARKPWLIKHAPYLTSSHLGRGPVPDPEQCVCREDKPIVWQTASAPVRRLPAAPRGC